jgi:4'-phosphopantetheinyl transferase
MSPTDLLHEVHAWEINPATIPAAGLYDRCFDWLSEQEQAKWQKFATAELRHDYLAARVLSRSSLSKYAQVEPQEWEFDIGPHGKPFISSPADFTAIKFNLTHTNELAICAVSLNSEVGVDAEDISRPVEVSEIARHFFSDQDRLELAHRTDQERKTRFFEIWVQKECYLKGCGTGLIREPDTFTIPSCPDGGIILYDGWRISLHRRGPRHVAAIAVQAADRPVAVQWKGAPFVL